MREQSSDLFAAYAALFVVATLGEWDAKGVRLFSSPTQQPVGQTSKRNAGRRGMDLPHRTLLTVIPSTKSQTSPLWEDKPL